MDQPTSIEIKMADDLFVKSIEIKQKHVLVPQHAHTYNHMSMLAMGQMRVWKDDICLGEFEAPKGIFIEANAKHRFLTLSDYTLIYCIHNLHKAEEVSVAEENAITESDLVMLKGL